MTPEHWKKIDKILQSALDLPSEERDRFLNEACANNQTLRDQIDSLLASSPGKESFIDRPAFRDAIELLGSDLTASMIGRAFGPYKILSEIGRGGMGEVYLAQDVRLGRKVAVKVLYDSVIADQDRVQRFEKEARAASALNHPNILTVYDIGQAEGLRFIATEFIEGETLRQRLLNSKPGFEEAIEISIQIANALDAAHRCQIVHRDIKPENLMLRPDGYVKVLDFGLAKLIESESTNSSSDAETLIGLKTEPGVHIGTTPYMSPEQAQGLAVDQRTDIWSLGVVLYEMVAGRRPFEGETRHEVLASILTKPAPPLRNFNSAVSAHLERIIEKSLTRNQNLRFQSAREMMEELRRFQQGLPTRIQSGATALNPRPKPRSYRNAVLFGLITLVAIAGFFIARWRSRSAVQTPPTMTMKPVTTAGKAKLAGISHNGSYFAYVLQESGKESLWVSQLDTPNATPKELPPPADGEYIGLTFSPLDSEIYYVMVANETGVLYRTPLFGGATTRVLNDIDTSVGFSRDGRRFAFVRNNDKDNTSTLMVANLDGSGEANLVTRPYSGGFISRPEWSPNDKLIACSAFTTPNSMGLFTVDVTNGTSSKITTTDWYHIDSAGWLPDGAALYMTARATSSSRARVWRVSYPDGTANGMTGDLDTYETLSLTSDASALLTVQSKPRASIWIKSIGPDSGPGAELPSMPSRPLTFLGLAWTPDGKLVFESDESGNFDLWTVNQDGSARRQLTNDSFLERHPVVSSDGRYIFASCDRGGSFNIWRFNMDGADARQITRGGNDLYPHLTPDGGITYTSWNKDGRPGLWKTSIEGGDPVQIAGGYSTKMSISGDGRMAVFDYKDDRPDSAIRIAFARYDPASEIDLNQVGFTSVPYFESQCVRWFAQTPDLAYIDPSHSNVRKLRYDAKQQASVAVTNFSGDSKEISSFELSPDGKRIALLRGSTTREVIYMKPLQGQSQVNGGK